MRKILYAVIALTLISGLAWGAVFIGNRRAKTKAKEDLQKDIDVFIAFKCPESGSETKFTVYMEPTATEAQVTEIGNLLRDMETQKKIGSVRYVSQEEIFSDSQYFEDEFDFPTVGRSSREMLSAYTMTVSQKEVEAELEQFTGPNNAVWKVSDSRMTLPNYCKWESSDFHDPSRLADFGRQIIAGVNGYPRCLAFPADGIVSHEVLLEPETTPETALGVKADLKLLGYETVIDVPMKIIKMEFDQMFPSNSTIQNAVSPADLPPTILINEAESKSDPSVIKQINGVIDVIGLGEAEQAACSIFHRIDRRVGEQASS